MVGVSSDDTVGDRVHGSVKPKCLESPAMMPQVSGSWFSETEMSGVTSDDAAGVRFMVQ